LIDRPTDEFTSNLCSLGIFQSSRPQILLPRPFHNISFHLASASLCLEDDVSAASAPLSTPTSEQNWPPVVLPEFKSLLIYVMVAPFFRLLESQNSIPHYLARNTTWRDNSTGIFAHYTANVVLTAGQPNPAKCWKGLKCCHFAVHAVPVADYGIPHQEPQML
jgi:hypothetical protein